MHEVIRIIEKDGWFQVRTRGSHRQYHHIVKPGTVTVAWRILEPQPAPSPPFGEEREKMAVVAPWQAIPVRICTRRH